MIESIIWLLVLEVIGLATLPVTFTFFSFLPERGYALSKPLGLLLLAFVVWFLGMLGLPFTALSSWGLLVLLMGGLGAWLWLRQGRALMTEMGQWFRRNLWLVVLVELLFILAYFYLVNLRSYMPEIRDQEKFGDFAFMNSMATHDKLPPNDPWMSGFTINYYYFSHFMVAMLTKMSGVAPSIAFNLSVPMIMAMTFVGAFSIVYNLVAIARQRGGLVASLSGVAAGVFVCVLGNLDTVRQLIAPRGAANSERDPNSVNFFFSWWSPSRVIYDYKPDFSGPVVTYSWNQTINEFPMFSFLLADMHPHVMALPFWTIVIAAAFNLLRAPATAGPLTLRNATGTLNFGILAVAIGALYFINTWDFPTFLLLVLGAALLRELWKGGEDVSEETSATARKSTETIKLALLGGNVPINVMSAVWGRSWRLAGFALRLGLTSLALYLPFHLTFTSLIGERPLPEPIKSIPLVSTIGRLFGAVAWDRTPLLGYFLVFGVFIFPMVSFLFLKLWPYLKEPYGEVEGQRSKVESQDEEIESRISKIENLDFESEDEDSEFEDEDFELNPQNSQLKAPNYWAVAPGLGLFLLGELLYFAGISREFSVSVGLVSAPVLAGGVGLLTKEVLNRVRPRRPAYELTLTLLLSAVLMIFLGWMVHFELYGPLLICTIVAGLLLWFETRKPMTEVNLADVCVLTLMFTGGVINWFTEVVYLRDLFESRFNTIFKFYYQSWMLYALAGAYASWRVMAYLWQARPFERSIEKSASNVWEEYQPQKLQPTTSFFRRQPALATSGNLAFSMGLSPAGGSGLQGGLRLEDLEELAQEEDRRQPKGRWLWSFGLVVLVLAGLIYPLLGPYEKTGKFAERKGLDGEGWVAQYYQSDYQGISWLREQVKANPNFDGVVLEAGSGYIDWINFSRVATFSGFPTVLGWYFHEAQWRGGSTKVMDEVNQRVKDVDLIYNTNDIEEARQLLQKYKVKYVFVGGIETNTASASLYSQVFKDYKPEGLAKFRQFLQPIYEKDGVTIYRV